MARTYSCFRCEGEVIVGTSHTMEECDTQITRRRSRLPVVDIGCKPPFPRTYVGDGLFAEFDGYQIWLIANDGDRDHQRVALESSVYDALKRYAQQVGFE